MKEALYHLDRSTETVIALGEGTDESNAKMQAALDYLWPYVGEMFGDDATDQAMAEAGVAPLPVSLKPDWDQTVAKTLDQACLKIPDSDFAHQGGRTGFRHTEHLGHMLATMQIVQRSYPGASW